MQLYSLVKRFCNLDVRITNTINITVALEEYLTTEYRKQKDAYIYIQSHQQSTVVFWFLCVCVWCFFLSICFFLWDKPFFLPVRPCFLRGARRLMSRCIRGQWTLLYCPEMHLISMLVQCPLVESKPFFDTFLAVPPSHGSFA